MRSELRSPLSLLLLGLILLVSACSTAEPTLSPDAQQAAIAADPPSGTAPAPLTVTFGAGAALSAAMTDATSHEWFVDGVLAGTGEALVHTFDRAGQFDVQLVVNGGHGEVSRAVQYSTLQDAAFDIELVFEEGSFTPEQQAMIQAAADRWEELVVGDIPDNSDMPRAVRESCLAIIGEAGGTVRPELQHVDYVDDLLVFVHRTVEPSSTLARAGPCYWNGRLPNYGRIEVNANHLETMTATDSLTEVMIHEFAHVLGVGTLWRARADTLLQPGLDHCLDAALEPERERIFTGAEGVREYQALGGVAQPPVDHGCGHWRQDVFGNESLTPSRSLTSEDNHTPLSRVTLGSVADLGYVVEYAAADPFSFEIMPASTPGSAPSFEHGEPFILTPEL